ncbi:MAG TPA: peptidylprolyl isomerase [Alphaproteobacteria bacterium]|nr:peptidylprolyl isomerase [Alphaproteobacteria bacterium]
MFVRFLSAIVAALFAAQSPAAAQSAASQSVTHVTVSTSKGDFVIALDAKRAPATVANFLRYVSTGHYDGTVFHRVIPQFMIQGGGFSADGFREKPTGRPIRNEADKTGPNNVGTVAMARTSDPHSATAQFFINANDNTHLDHSAKSARGWGYTVFGRVVRGMDVVRAIEAVQTRTVGPFENVPAEAVVIRSIKPGGGK